MKILSFAFGEPTRGAKQQQRETAQGDTLLWTIPHCEIPLMLNGVPIGYCEVHLHAAWAPDGVPDTSFGFTGRVNTEEFYKAVKEAGL